jgi:hypothetical protein
MDYSRIAENISTIEDYHNFISSSKHVMNSCSHLHQKMFDKLQNHLWLLIKLLPDKDWDWRYISRNVSITWDIIEQNLENQYKWDWDAICQNTNITWDIVRSNKTFSTGPNKGKNIPWKYFLLRNNPNFTWEIMSKYFPSEYFPPNDAESWKDLSINKSITWDVVKKNLDKPWDWEYLSECMKITMGEVKENIRSDHPAPWCFDYLAINPYISLEDIENTPEFLEHVWKLSHNKNITWEFVKKNLDKIWNWIAISCNRNITWDVIKNTKISIDDLHSEGKYYLINDETSPLITIGASSNPNITWDIVISNPEFPWDFISLSTNPNITWKIVRDNPTTFSSNKEESVKKFLYLCVSKFTEDLTWKDVIDNPDFPWDFLGLSSNTFGK